MIPAEIVARFRHSDDLTPRFFVVLWGEIQEVPPDIAFNLSPSVRDDRFAEMSFPADGRDVIIRFPRGSRWEAHHQDELLDYSRQYFSPKR